MEELKTSITEINIQLKELQRMKNEVLELNASEAIVKHLESRLTELKKAKKKEHIDSVQKNLKRS